jgi:hypothetical protein
MNRGMFTSASDEWETPREFFDTKDLKRTMPAARNPNLSMIC